MDSTIKGFLSSRNLNTQRTEAADRIEELEARLANASVALKQALDSLSFAAHELAAQAHIPEEDSEMLRDRISCVVTTIAKIKGKQP